MAYIVNQDEFKMFYHGKVTTMFAFNASQPLQYEVGQDVVAYIKNNDHSFNVYWSGRNYKVEDTIPLSFMAGNSYVAYVDKKGIFKLFTKGRVAVISELKPGFFKVTDDIIVYSEKNDFKAYYKGVSYLLEKYIPKSYQYDNACIAYTDNTGALILFIDGKKETVSRDVVITDFSMNGSLLKYVSAHKTWIFYKGKIY